MSGFGWLRSPILQSVPEEMALAWAVAGVLFVLLIVVTAFTIRQVRIESDSESDTDFKRFIDTLEEPLAVLEPDGTLQTTNVSFERIFGSDAGGKPIESVFDSYPRLQSIVTEGKTDDVAIEDDGKTSRYQVHTYPIEEQSSSAQKRIVLFCDVTSYHRKQERLKAENEQLDQFASLISHDLRNPLDVAIGRTNAVKDVIDDPELELHLSRTQESHQRMRQIITDMLALAREGHDIGEPECVPLETAAMDGWAHVDTGNASLAVNTQLVIEADREQLTRIFENLFRNAVQHCGEDVHVEVGRLEDGTGFFVADDGDGIAPEEKRAILEAGYTTGGSGTGLGLAIVTSIAEAHGWEVGVSNSEQGGARFEFSGVTMVSDGFVTQQVE